MIDAKVFLDLARPFEAGEVKFKPATVAGNRCLALAYVDARLVMDRLDDVLGPNNWADEYQVLPDGAVVCTLKVRFGGPGGEWIAKTDVGGESEQPDEGDRRKAAFSDALKRAAVKYGIGRYLYRLPRSWVDYDPQKKQMVKPPQLPSWALPRAETRNESKPTQAKPNGATLPKDGAELYTRLLAFDKRLADQGHTRPGELLRVVSGQAIAAGFDGPIAEYAGPAVAFAVSAARTFADSKVRITADQHKALVQLIKDRGADPQAFCDKFRIEDTDRLLARDLEAATLWLQAEDDSEAA